MGEREEKENIVLFPFMAQGHIIPFLALALHIERTKKNYTITFVNTPLNIQNLKSALPPPPSASTSTSRIRFVEIPFNSEEHGLPPHAENTDILPYPLIIKLIHASTSLRPAFKTLLQQITQEQGGKPPLCVIADIFFGWTTGVARELGLFHAIFSSCGFGFACYYSLWLSLPHRNMESGEVYESFELQDFIEASRFHKTQLPLNILEADGTDSWSVFQRKNLAEWKDSDGVLFNTVEEFDEVGLSYFRRKLGRPAWAIGPILLSKENRAGVSADSCKDWLDTKPEGSVLYASFGSNNTISPSQMIQLAMALEGSGKNFIWVVRPPIGFDINSEFRAKEWLPPGFEERAKDSGRGLIVQRWAPQVEILSHRSTGAFLSHCGWNSVLEALNNGVPLIGWGMAAEQFFNVKFLEEEWGVCVEVARGKTCEVRHEDVRTKIELVMNQTEKRKEMTRKACEIKEMMRSATRDEDGSKGSSVQALDDFFNAAMLRH
ncbi:hypothetical protein Tsubulata_043433 [Turnera subulata]|uniref:Glycosyltransferase n=1 Tax=Turnera subulata TaxID=218843 RepID=A0A9Q0JK84_9ROSI|nr:hypothetical protein Tsubulata_043433 [Turnera subulata]